MVTLPHYRLIFIQWLIFLTSVTSIWPMIWEKQSFEGCRDGAVGGNLPPGWCKALCSSQRHQQSPGEIPAGGHQSVTTPAQDRFLVVQAHRARSLTATFLRNDIANAAGVRVSTQTNVLKAVWRYYVVEMTLHMYPLTRRHHQAHWEWSIHGWSCNTGHILFTDDSRFCLDFTDRRARVWKWGGERF
jgi:hypothetical protein